MSEISHYEAIRVRLSHERARVESAKRPREREWREHNVRMIERELAGEVEFLARRGIEIPPEPAPMTDDELLAALGA